MYTIHQHFSKYVQHLLALLRPTGTYCVYKQGGQKKKTHIIVKSITTSLYSESKITNCIVNIHDK